MLCTRRVRDPVRVDFPGEGATEGGGYASDQQQLGLEKGRVFPQITKHNEAERITFGCFLDVFWIFLDVFWMFFGCVDV